MDLRKATVIECIASTPDKDVVGEALDIGGADITPLLEGRGFVNSDHSAKFEHLVGRVLEAKKIESLKDCDTPSQLKYWNDVKKPFIWAKAELWDGVGHKEADAIASIYKFYQGRTESAPIKVSVEGKTLERGANGLLKRTLIRGLALTVHPCNRATRTDVVSITKSHGASSLVKSEDYMAPMFIEIEDSPMERLYQLALVARQLLQKANSNFAQAKSEIEVPALKSRALLEQLKTMIASKRS